MATKRLKVGYLLADSPSPATSQQQLTSYAARFPSAQAITSRELRRQAELYPEAVVNLRLLVKGVRWAFGIEGAAALCLYAIWFVRHLRL